MAEEQASPTQKLFRLPGTIDEEDCEREQQRQRCSRPESPLLAQKNNVNVISSCLSKNVTLLRVNTQSSSIAGITRQDSSRSRYRAGPARKLRRRAVLKSGDCNVLQSRISRRSLRFLQDIFTTLVDTQWRWTLLCFALSFVLSWLGFAGIWYLIAFTHGDFDPRHQADPNWRPCVVELHSFTSCFLFSIETQHTIGYGGRATTEECPEAIFMMCAQSISGVMIQALMVGIVFAKMSRPKQRTQTLLFSKQAVICQRDGELCLMFRVGDMRKSHIIGASVRAQLIKSRTTKEGEVLPHNQYELVVGADGQTANLFFIWPCTVVHRIDADSPFYNMSAEDMLTERFEIVVILEGTIESTGQTTQARSSYLPQEVLWGHRFEPLVSYSKDRQGYDVDYSKFNSTVQVDTPLCSGRELAEFYRLQDSLRHQTSLGFITNKTEPASPVLSACQINARASKYFQPLSQSQMSHHPQQYHQQHQQPRSEFSVEDKNASTWCPECSGPPPYGRTAATLCKDICIVDMDEEEVALMNKSILPTDDESHQLLEREKSSLERKTRFRSCQDLQRPKQQQRYLLVALEDLDSELCSSYPSVLPRRYNGSKEQFSSLRLSNRREDKGGDIKRAPILDKELREMVAHRLMENERSSTPSTSSTTLARDKSSLERTQLPEASSPEVCCNGSEGSCETNSSSESEVSSTHTNESKANVAQPLYTNF